MAATFEGAQPAALSTRRAVMAIVASTLGLSFDYFDLLILLYAAPAVGKAFFPSDSPTLSLAAVYASFAVTLLMRPVGSAMFGNYADRHGRKGAMVIAVVGVGIATALSGFCLRSPRSASPRRSCSLCCAWSKAFSSVACLLRPTRSGPSRSRRACAG